MQVQFSPRRRLGTFRIGETVAHNIPVGVWSVNQIDVSLLDDEWLSIWDGGTDGVPPSPFKARDRVLRAFFLVLSLLAVASFAFAQDAQWKPIQIPDCPNCVITTLHFYTPQEGWAVAYQANVPPNQKFLLRTRDGGDTWVSQPVAEKDYQIYNRSHFLNPFDGWAPADGYIRPTDPWDFPNAFDEDHGLMSPVRFYQTQDGGNSWVLREGRVTGTTFLGDQGIAQQVTTKYPSGIAFLSRMVGVMAGLAGKPLFDYAGHVILRTTDGGATWHAAVFGDSSKPCGLGDRPHPVLAIEFIDDRYGWIPAPAYQCLRKHLFRTTDGGESWEILTFEGPGVGRNDYFGPWVEFVSPTEGWSWPHSLTHTMDGGKTWETGLIGWGITFISPKEGWLVGYPQGGDNRIRWIQHTIDGGQTWQLEYQLRSEQIDELKYDIAAQALWAYGPFTFIRRQGAVTGVEPRGKLSTTWGRLKKPKGE